MTEEESIKKFIGSELMRHKDKDKLKITDNLIESGIIKTP